MADGTSSDIHPVSIRAGVYKYNRTYIIADNLVIRRADIALYLWIGDVIVEELV